MKFWRAKQKWPQKYICMPVLPVRRSISTDNGFELFEKKLLYDPRPNILPPFFSSSFQIALFVFGSAFGVRLVFWTSRLDGHKSLRLSPLILTAAGTHKHINIYQIQLYYLLLACCLLAGVWATRLRFPFPNCVDNDETIAKLASICKTIFGRRRRKKTNQPKNDSNKQ